MSRRKHDPAPLFTYIQAHENNIGQRLSAGQLVSDNLDFVAAEGHLVIVGRLQCRGGIYIDVRKRVLVLEDGKNPLVQTVEYSYNVALPGVGNIFRYDSPHPDHNRDHHVHRYDVLNGDHEGVRTFIYDENQRPTLGEVIDEAVEWYYDNLERLIEMGLVRPADL